MKLDVLLPVAAPAPAGLIIGIHLFNETLKQVGAFPAEWGPLVNGLAALVAAAGCVGMIGAEITAYKQAGIALAENQTKAALVAAFAGIVCSALVIWAVWTGDGSRAVVGSVIISVMGYLALASRDFLARRRGVAQSAETSADKDKSFALGMEKEKTKQAAAAARLAKASAAPVQVSKIVQNGHAPAPRPENVEAVRGWLANNTGSDRQAAKDLKLSPSTIKACKVYLEQQNDKRN